MATQVRYRESSQPAFVDRRAKVWLECNGEPYDRRAVREVAATVGAGGVLIVSFVCPRCGGTHESLLFR